MDGYTFKALDGRKYRTTGEFRPPAKNEFFVDGSQSADDIRRGHALVIPAIRSKDADHPRIIVTPVAARYEVTVTLSEEEFQHLKGHIENCACESTGKHTAPLVTAIRNGDWHWLDD